MFSFLLDFVLIFVDILLGGSPGDGPGRGRGGRGGRSRLDASDELDGSSELFIFRFCLYSPACNAVMPQVSTKSLTWFVYINFQKLQDRPRIDAKERGRRRPRVAEGGQVADWAAKSGHRDQISP